MKIKLFKLLIVGSVLITACNKGSNNSIDVSEQWKVDGSGFLISGLSDGQWGNKNLTTQELNLFTSLDTVNLTGTTMPDSVFEEKPITHNFSFPNPFNQISQLSFSFTGGYSGEFVLKYVIVNSGLTILDKGSIKIQATVCSTCPNLASSSGIIQLTPKIPSGQFRLYYTLSSQANNNFYKTWGNIQKN